MATPSAGDVFIDFGDGEGLSRSELQMALKHYRLPSSGTNVALRELYQQYRDSQMGRNTSTAAVVPASAAAAKKPPPTQTTPAASEKKAAPPEQRLKRYRSSCPTGIHQRIERASTQRMFLVRKDDEPTDNLTCQFIILGSTGNVYTVEIGKLASCTCPDHLKGNLCKHILFVLIKVMAINPTSPLIYQEAWLESELRDMFHQMSERYRRVSGAVLANSKVRATYAKLEKGVGVDDDEAETDESTARRQQVQEDDDCPICLDTLQGSGSKTTFCRSRCGANFHQACINQWLHQHRSKPTCPNCRETWDDGKATVGTPTKEGFTNLGQLQGQSPDRDTATYSSWFQSQNPDMKRRRRW